MNAFARHHIISNVDLPMPHWNSTRKGTFKMKDLTAVDLVIKTVQFRKISANNRTQLQ